MKSWKIAFLRLDRFSGSHCFLRLRSHESAREIARGQIKSERPFSIRTGFSHAARVDLLSSSGRSSR